MADRPNYYRLLKLDPDEQNWSVIEKRIKEFEHKYNRVASDASKQAQADADCFQIHLKHPAYAISMIMQDEKLRRAEADDRRRQLVEETKQLDAMLILLSRRGSYTQADVDEIARALPGFHKEQIEARILKVGLREGGPKKTNKSTRPKKAQLSKEEAQIIEPDLKGLQLPHLYAFLGEDYGPNSSLEAVKTAAKSQEDQLKLLIQGTPARKVRTRLLDHIKAHLLDKEKRRRYDNYLEDAKLRELDTRIRLRGGAGKRIDDDGLNDIIRSTHGVTPDAVRQYVEEWVEGTKGWTLSVGSQVAAERLLTCGACGALAGEEHQQSCQNCGKSLRRLCPRPGCGQMVATQNACCPKCGCTTGDARRVESLLKEGEALFEKSRYAEAKRRADGVLDLWRDYPPARQLLAKVEEALQLVAKKRESINRLVPEHKLLEAQRLAGELASHGFPIDQATLRQVETEINAARGLFEEANRLAVACRIDEALDKWLAALGHCTDYQVAIDAIARHPPSAPGDLTREQTGPNAVRLKWRPTSQQSAIGFIVCRKEGGLPATSEDGRIAEVKGTSFDDTSVAIGKAWHYAVYAVLRKTASRSAATCPAILLPGQVSKIAATAIDGEVRLTWTLPLGCDTVEIKGRPSGQARNVRGNEFVESGLQIGRFHEYELSALYPDPNRGGQIIRSAPRKVNVHVTARPTPVVDLRAEVQGNRVKLSWTPPKVGRLEIRSSDRPPADGLVKSLVDLNEAERFGEALPRLGLGAAEAPLPASGQAFYVPVTVEGTTAAIGQWKSVINLPEVRDFRTRPLANGRVELSWEWPAGIDAVRITVAPTSQHWAAKGSITAHVTGHAFHQNGNVWHVSCTRAEPYRISVSTKAPQGDLYSAGVTRVECLGHETRVQYSLNSGPFRRLRSARPAITLTTDSEWLGAVHGLVVVGHPERLPTRIDEGAVIHEADSITFSEGRAELPIPTQGLATSLYLKLFLKHPDRYPQLRLLPASKDKLFLQR